MALTLWCSPTPGGSSAVNGDRSIRKVRETGRLKVRETGRLAAFRDGGGGA